MNYQKENGGRFQEILVIVIVNLHIELAWMCMGMEQD